MNESVNRAMCRAISVMYQHIGEEITVDDMASTAMYSKFHFSRMFRQATGVSPGRFLSAIRFQEAKRLLAATSLSVAEISNRVGYSSIGTFSTRFKKLVGVTPTEYRRGEARPTWRVRDDLPNGRSRGRTVTIHGRVRAAVDGDCGTTYVGLFPDLIPEITPLRSTVLPNPGDYVLDDVPEGTWYLLAHGVLTDGAAAQGPVDAPLGSVGRVGPITVRAADGPSCDAGEVELRPMLPVDMPLLAAPFTTRPRTPAAQEPPRPASASRAVVAMRRPGHSTQPRRGHSVTHLGS